MTIKFNDGTTFKINQCTERIANSIASLNFEIIGDYSASYIQDLIIKQEEAIYTLIDEEGKERIFIGYTEIHNIESYFEKVLADTLTEVVLRKA